MSFFSFDSKHISRLLGSVAGMDKEISRYGIPADFRKEFWTRFGGKRCKVITKMDEYLGLPLSEGKNSFFFDPNETNRITQYCGSCGHDENVVYEIYQENDLFMYRKYIATIYTHMGDPAPGQENKFELESTEPLNMIQFLIDYKSTIIDLAEAFSWKMIIQAVRKIN